jgi:site-specific recombinase XerD
MATVKAILNTKYKSKDGTYPIVLRLINGKQQKLHPTGHKIKPSYWKDGQVSPKHEDAEIINSTIDEELLKAKRYFADCKIKSIPIDLELVFKQVKSHSFTDYLRHRAKQHEAADQIEMQFKINRFVKELLGCFQREIYFSEVNQDFLRKFDTWLKDQGNSNNTRHKKFEFLGKYYSNAIIDKKASLPNPFKEYKIKTTPVKKDKLSLQQIKALEELKLIDPTYKFARDLFLFSYYCKGIRFETAITMRKKQIVGSRIAFTANKGGKIMSVQIHSKLQAIIEQYKKNDTEYIFGKLSVSFEDLLKSNRLKRSKIGAENAMVNRSLKTIASLAEINIDLSFHHSRHSLAFHLKQASGNIGAIQDILGHSRSAITEVYLKSLDDEYLDQELQKVYGN